MNYDLVKQLKDAGYPIVEHTLPFDTKGERFTGYTNGDILWEKPKLSELIEACMDFYYPSYFEMGGSRTWWAVLRYHTNVKALVSTQTGSTPEEAIAKLWLALNKPKKVSPTPDSYALSNDELEKKIEEILS